VISVALAPAVHALTRRGIPGWLAVTLVLLVVVALFAVLSLVVTVSLANLDERLPVYRQRFDQLLGATLPLLAQIPGLAPVEFDLGLLISQLSTGTAISGATRLAGGILSGLTDVVIVVLIVIYMLFEALGFRRRLVAAIGPDRNAFRILTDIGHDLQRYVVLSGAFGAVVAVINTVLLLILGVDFALLWGLLSFVLSFVPNIGFVIALVPPAAVALLQYDWERALAVVVGYIIINTVVDSGIKPKIMGDGVNLSPLTVLLFLVLGAWLLGPLGTLLAVPLAIVVKLALAAGPETRWLAVLMSDKPERTVTRPPGEPPAPAPPDPG
jgi:predicted PurR-regulated permease PerM